MNEPSVALERARGFKVYAVAVMNRETGELVPLPSVTEFTAPKSEESDKVFCLDDLQDVTVTWTFSPEVASVCSRWAREALPSSAGIPPS